MSIFTKIAYEEGVLFSKWGPCSDGSYDPCQCKQCKWADKLESEGKDYSEEYDKAMINA